MKSINSIARYLTVTLKCVFSDQECRGYLQESLCGAENFSPALRSVIVMIFLLAPSLCFSQPYSDVSIGEYSQCALEQSGYPVCTLSDLALRLAVPEDMEELTQISAGETHICGTKIDGALRCWGDNYFGQQDVPTSDYPFVQLDAGRNHTCAIDSSEKLVCWGLNDTGQATVPGEGLGFIRVSAGTLSSCGVRATGELQCWGSSIDIGTVPIDLGPVSDVSVGYRRVCALTIGGNVQCWGEIGGALAGGPYISLAITDSSVCGLTLAGRVFCEFDYSSLQSEFQAIVSDDTRLVSIESGSNGTCGQDVEGNFLCWGTRLSLPGALGDPVPAPSNIQVFTYSSTTAEITWQATDSIPVYLTSGFYIYRNAERLAFTENGSSFIDKTLDSAMSYSYAISQLLKDGRESEQSENTVVYGSGLQPAVDNLRARIYSASAVELFWDAVASDTAQDYTVKRNGQPIYTGNDRSYFDDQLLPGTRYSYSVDKSLSDTLSSPVTIAIATLAPYRLPEKVPATPTGLDGQVYSHTALELFWDRDDAVPPIRYYEISRDFEVVATINGTSYFDKTLQGLTTYQYDIVSIDVEGQRSAPAVITITTP